ncbi:acyl carrier protein [Brevibacillus brevis]|uniref:acyl carrier protein n=2 Tax=Brevibacillus TaxID=55080 RepID=UPI0014773287|nr:acyl carrier protein [Brevibacillus brevis]
MEHIIETIITKIKELAELGEEVKINPEDPLIRLGINSIKAMELLVEIENTLGVVVEDDELLIENFTSVKKIADLIASKIGE